MDIALPLDKMTVEGKLRILERIWEDLSKTPDSIPSPAWHRDVLEARQKRLAEGHEQFIPFEKVKEEIRPAKP